MKAHPFATTLIGCLFAVANAVPVVASTPEDVEAGSPTTGSTFEVATLEDGALLVNVENSHFGRSDSGEVTILDDDGNLLETLPEELADYEIIGRTMLVASEPGTGFKEGTAFFGFCPLGHYDHGGCRGGGVAKGAVRGAITGGAGGCAAGTVGGMIGGPGASGAACGVGAATGAVGGAVTGAIAGGLGWD